MDDMFVLYASFGFTHEVKVSVITLKYIMKLVKIQFRETIQVESWETVCYHNCHTASHNVLMQLRSEFEF